MKSVVPYWIVVLLGIPLSILFWHSWATSRSGPDNSLLSTVEGQVTTLNFPTSTKYGIQGAMFTISGDSRNFYYPSFQHNFYLLRDHLTVGAYVQLRASLDKKPNIWSMKVNQVWIANESETFENIKENRIWALYLGLIFPVMVVYSGFKISVKKRKVTFNI